MAIQLLNQPRRLVLIMLLNLGLAVVLLTTHAQTIANGVWWAADFTAYYTGWTMVRDGEGANLYDLDVQTRYQQAILDGRQFRDGVLPYVNPPYFALPGVPLALLSREAAQVVWLLLNLLLLGWLIRSLLGLAAGWRPGERWVLVTALLGFFPLYTTLLLGSFPLLLTLALLQCYLALRRGDDRAAAAWLLVASIKFQLILLLGVWLLAGRRWRVLAWGIAFGLVAAGLTTLVLGWRVWGEYLGLLRLHSASYDRYGINPEDALTLKGTLALLLGQGQAGLIQQIASGALLLAAGLTAWITARDPRPAGAALGLQFGTVIMLNLLFSLHLNFHDALLLVLPAALFYDWLRERPGAARFGAFAALCPLLFFVGDVLFGKRLGVQIPVLLMAAALAWMLRAVLGGRTGQSAQA
jgi:hypothetical protein